MGGWRSRIVAVGKGDLRPHPRHLASQTEPIGVIFKRPTKGSLSLFRLPTPLPRLSARPESVPLSFLWQGG